VGRVGQHGWRRSHCWPSKHLLHSHTFCFNVYFICCIVVAELLNHCSTFASSNIILQLLLFSNCCVTSRGVGCNSIRMSDN